MSTADDATRRRLRAAIHAIVHPIVFTVVTRKVELRRGHRGCLRGFRHLTTACLDAFSDDVEALIDRLLATRTPITDLDSWLACRAPGAAVDAHRRRRGERGALQRPRITKALETGLGHDRWLLELARLILVWVGIPADAGSSLWPLDEWSQRRALITGDHEHSTPRTVESEVSHVLNVMRQRGQWYADHVERPLGRKDAPLSPPAGDAATDPRPLRPYGPDDQDDTHAQDLAALALSAITARLRAGLDEREAVLPVISALFLGGTGAELIDREPGTVPAGEEFLPVRLADDDTAGRIVREVLAIVRQITV
ncbi:hypothetical protein KOI35_32485 [Actinoplanes bogorensis]|uniref:Uncharacterized protein n=1 Tax=Paractinoplanes bogorensis TaxID=1610840 RepID=A0ABS5YXR1_9ACTN|nr:hypothetical protein [Actinoplanes bogorensis]MBU2668240.1 hypothetical protein [Actinoplanes bogorensis]